MTLDLLTAREAADLLGRSRGFVLALVADGLVYGFKRRGRWYISRVYLEAWVAAGSRDPGAPVPLAVVPGVVTVRRGRAA